MEFGQKLREARIAAGLSQREVARRGGISIRTVINVEQGHDPSADTMRRLLGIVALGLTAPARDLAPFAPGYDPMRQTEDMLTFFEGPGGSQDQAWLYLEPQGARDFRRYCGDPAFALHYRDPLPLAEVAKEVAIQCRPVGLDVLALGPGDGVVETRLCGYFVTREQLPINLDLLDCSHSLLSVSFRHACDALSPYGVKVHAVHGDFYKLLGYEAITYRAPNDMRHRAWTLFGHTIGNLRDELDFFGQLATVSRAGDFLIFDYQTTRDADALVGGNTPEPVARWITGPLRRALGLGDQIPTVTATKTERCPVPGSYAVKLATRVRRGDKDFACELAQVKRYDPQQLADTMRDLGWRPIQHHRYGPAPQLCGLLLCEKVETA